MNWTRLILKNWEKHFPAYLSSNIWTLKRRLVLIRDRQRCGCGRTASVVHHKRYDNVGREPLSDLISLCVECHKDMYEKKRICNE